MDLTPEQRIFQDTNREARNKAAIKSGLTEAEVATWGLGTTATSFFSILTPYASENETPVNMTDVEEEWTRIGNDTHELATELRTHDLLEERADGYLYVTDLGREAIQYLY